LIKAYKTHTPVECGSYRGIKLLEHAMKVVERVFEHRIRQQVEVDDTRVVPKVSSLIYEETQHNNSD